MVEIKSREKGRSRPTLEVLSGPGLRPGSSPGPGMLRTSDRVDLPGRYPVCTLGAAG